MQQIGKQPVLAWTSQAARNATSQPPHAKRWWWYEPIAAATDLLFPPHCAMCGGQCEPRRDGPLLCEPCDAALAIDQRPSCRRCAMSVSEIDAAGEDCPSCRGRRLRFEEARAVGAYQDALRQAVLKGKQAV